MPGAGWSILLLAVAGCVDARPVRLVAGHSDTVIVNIRAPVPLAVRLVDASGVEHLAKGVRYQLIAGGDVELDDNGRVTCDHRGDAEVAATYGDLSTRLTVLCRPIKGFRMPRELRLTIGAPPARLDVGAMGVDGKPVDAIAGTASVRDSQVVTLVDGYLHARARGTTMVDVEAGGCAVAIPVEVVESSRTSDGLLPHEQYAESLSMAAGELRSWRLAPGKYEISLFGDDGAPADLRLASYQMNCAALPRTEQQYWCIAKDRASVIVRHTQPAGRGRQSTATLLVHRRGDPGSEYASPHPRPLIVHCPFFL
jgi:hypothetical protein